MSGDDKTVLLFILIGALVALSFEDARKRWKHQAEMERLASRSLWQKIRGRP